MSNFQKLPMEHSRACLPRGRSLRARRGLIAAQASRTGTRHRHPDSANAKKWTKSTETTRIESSAD